MESEQDRELLQKTVNHYLDHGVNEIIAKLVVNQEHQIRFSNSAIDISKQWNQHELELFLAIGRKFSVITIQNPSLKKIKERLPQDIKNLKNLPKSILYWGMDKKKHDYEQIQGLHDKTIETFTDKAPELVNSTINSSFEAGAKKVAGVLYFGNSKRSVLTGYGNGGVYDSSYYRMTIRSFVDPESSGQDMAVGRNLINVEKEFTEAGKNAGQLAKMAEGGKQGKLGTYDIILSPTVAANIFNHIYDGANPIYVIGRMSCLRGIKMGQKIAPGSVTISDNPLIPEGLNSRPFDFEGTPSQETKIIKNGKLAGLIQNTSSAKIWRLLQLLKFKVKKINSTANSFLGGVVDESMGPRVLAPIASNYAYQPGNVSLEEMIAESKKPTIYITSNWYTRFTNYVEGKFSTIPRDGMFLIENGKITRPIRKMRLTETLLGMLSRIEAIGNELKQIYWWEVMTPTFIPAIKVRACRMTAATE